MIKSAPRGPRRHKSKTGVKRVSRHQNPAVQINNSANTLNMSDGQPQVTYNIDSNGHAITALGQNNMQEETNVDDSRVEAIA